MIKMKDSGIPWIGQIPENWKIKRNKNVMVKKKDICYDYNNQNILSLTMKGVIKRDLDNPMGKMPSSFNGYQEIHKNNLLLCLFDIDVTPRCVGIIKDDGLTSPAYSQYVLIDNNNPYYFCYLLQSLDDDKVFIHLSKNLRSSLTDEDFGCIFTICPPKEIQQKIVEILDKKCGQIDELVRIEENEIEKLKEYKTSLITKVVTKGLDSNAKMKDSGIPWIGQIPEDWKVGRLKFYLSEQLKYGTNENGIPYDEVNPRYIRITDILDNNQLTSKKEDMQSLPTEKAIPFMLKKGDLLFARSGATVGKTFLFLDDSIKSSFAGYLILARVNNNLIDYKFLYYYTLSNSYNKWKNYIFIQATIQNIGANKYKDLEITIPNTSIQQQIVEYLDKRCEEIDNLIKIKQEKIEKLKEYKKSLIYQYVTGKKEVI